MEVSTTTSSTLATAAYAITSLTLSPKTLSGTGGTISESIYPYAFMNPREKPRWETQQKKVKAVILVML
jgi:hypothetical protein